MPRRPSIIFLTIAALIAGALVGAPSTSRAQEPAPTLQIHQVDGSAYPTMRAVVSALDGGGDPIAGLGAGAFRPFEGETPITLNRLAPASDPDQRLSVALIIDVSSNMQGAPLDAAKLSAIAFVQGLGPGDRAAVFAFNDEVMTVVPFTLDRDALTYGIASLGTEGGSALFEAAQTGSFAIGAVAAERKAVIVLTASGNTSQRVTAERALGVGQDAGAPVFAVALGPAADEAFLSQLAGVTMGQYRAVGENDAGVAVREVATVLRGQYVLTMTGSGIADSHRGELRLIADIAGSPAGAVAGFRRGPAPNAITEPGGGEGSSTLASVGLIALVVLVVLGLVAAGGYWGGRIARDIRVVRHQRDVVAPNQQRAAAQPLPRPVGPLRTVPLTPLPAMSVASPGTSMALDPSPSDSRASSMPSAGPTVLLDRSSTDDEPPAATSGTVPAATPTSAARGAESNSIGKFVEKTPHGRGQTYELGAGPIVIGSSPRECTIVLPAGPDVAPAHVRIWLRNEKYVMHHAGGFRRRTLVGGQPTDWCVLEHGDELQIGPHKLVYVEEGNQRPLRF